MLYVCVLLKVLRPKLVDEKFMKNLGKFLCNVQSIDSGSTQIQSATGLYSSIILNIVFAMTCIQDLVQKCSLLEFLQFSQLWLVNSV